MPCWIPELGLADMKIFLVGMPGSGKSTLGEEASLLLKIPYFDLDEGIENKEEKSIPDIFAEQGEKYFRTLESKLLRRFPKLTGHFVLSTGGGAPCFFDNMGFMNEEGRTIFLDVPTETLMKRLIASGLDDRPLLKGKSEEELHSFLESQLRDRRIHYQKAMAVLEGSDLKAQDILDEIKKRGWV